MVLAKINSHKVDKKNYNLDCLPCWIGYVSAMLDEAFLNREIWC
jgi:hypothetical protein